MKKNRNILILVLVLAVIAVGILLRTLMHKGENIVYQDTSISISDKNVVQDSVNESNVIADRIPSDWKTYTNNNFGVTFKYPKTWTQNGDESNTINRNGEVLSISISFIDTITNSNFYLAYHLAPYGAEMYKLAEEDYISFKNTNEINTKQISVSGNNAIETLTTMSKDIKGNIYDPALKLIHIVFLDKQKTGGFNLNFRTPAPGSEKEIAKFNQLLSTFKFTI